MQNFSTPPLIDYLCSRGALIRGGRGEGCYSRRGVLIYEVTKSPSLDSAMKRLLKNAIIVFF